MRLSAPFHTKVEAHRKDFDAEIAKMDKLFNCILQ